VRAVFPPAVGDGAERGDNRPRMKVRRGRFPVLGVRLTLVGMATAKDGERVPGSRPARSTAPVGAAAALVSA
jgi:hypothetical protein